MTRCVCPLPPRRAYPPRSAKQQRRKDPFRARGNAPQTIHPVRTTTHPARTTTLSSPRAGPARRRPLRGHRPRPATVGAQDVPERVRPVRGPRHRGCLHRHLHLPRQSTPTPAAAALRVSAGAPAAIPAAVPGAVSTITTFPPSISSTPPVASPSELDRRQIVGIRPGRIRRPRDGGAAARGPVPQTSVPRRRRRAVLLLVKGTRAMDHLPPPIDVVRRLRASGADAFVSHPNDVAGS